jgi:hypothetical protein
MIKKNKIMCYGYLFMAIFIAKMVISVAPIFLAFEKKEISSVIIQLELDSEKENNGKDAKDLNELKKGVEFVHLNLFGLKVSADLENKDYHYLLRQYPQVYFASVPTPPPDLT